jgi:hypothetical protein
MHSKERNHDYRHFPLVGDSKKSLGMEPRTEERDDDDDGGDKQEQKTGFYTKCPPF